MDINPEPITARIFKKKQRRGTLPILPLTTEYTWYLSGGRYESTLNLALHDLNACAQAGIPFVPLAHVFPLLQDKCGHGIMLYEQLFREVTRLAGTRNEPVQFPMLSDTT